MSSHFILLCIFAFFSKIIGCSYKKCDRVWENRSYPHINWNPVFVHNWKVHSCTTQKHQVLGIRWPGLLLQMAFCWCCKTTKVHVMVLGRVNRTAWGTKLLLTAVWASLVDFTSSHPLLKAQHCSLSPNGCFTLPLAPHPPPPLTPPFIESIRDITGAEKSYQKTNSIQVPCWNSYKMLAIYITTLLIWDIWRDCIVPQEKDSASIFKISITRNTKCADKTGFPRPGHKCSVAIS